MIEVVTILLAIILVAGVIFYVKSKEEEIDRLEEKVDQLEDKVDDDNEVRPWYYRPWARRWYPFFGPHYPVRYGGAPRYSHAPKPPGYFGGFKH